MNRRRWKDLQENGGELTTEEIAEGWHFCYDWDFLLIHQNDEEAQACHCKGVCINNPKPGKQS